MTEAPAPIEPTSPRDGSTRPASGGQSPPTAALTADQVWHHLERASFAVVSYVTPSGDPRSSGVLFKAVGSKLYVVVAPDSWKAKHISVSGRVAMTVPVRRGGLLSLVAPIPPATISFHGNAVVHPADSMEIPNELAPLVPPARRTSSSVIEVEPVGTFVTYGIGVSLMKMRDPAQSRARVPMGDAVVTR